MKQQLSYQIPRSEGHNFASYSQFVHEFFEALDTEESKPPIDRFALNLCGCLEGECTCYFLAEVSRLKEKNQWWG